MTKDHIGTYWNEGDLYKVRTSCSYPDTEIYRMIIAVTNSLMEKYGLHRVHWNEGDYILLDSRNHICFDIWLQRPPNLKRGYSNKRNILMSLHGVGLGLFGEVVYKLRLIDVS
jgi:hypothetical protein